jgi:hypothetical protein
LVGCHTTDVHFMVSDILFHRTRAPPKQDAKIRMRALHCHCFSQVAKRDGSKVDSLRQGHRCYELLGSLSSEATDSRTAVRAVFSQNPSSSVTAR